MAFIDDSAGYHARRTAWHWSAGHGRLEDGRAVGWNLVAGVHDGEPSERTVWVDGEPHEVGPVEFADDLSRVGDLEFSRLVGARGPHQPPDLPKPTIASRSGRFAASCQVGFGWPTGYGVMEEHDVRW